jgi:putative oxidoreductase
MMGQIGLWACQIALSTIFVFAGGAKFVSPAWPRMFARWGYPEHFHLLVGVVEVVAGLALLVPRSAPHAALVLIVVMIGAGLTHILHGEHQRLIQIILMSTLLAIVAWRRARYRNRRCRTAASTTYTR